MLDSKTLSYTNTKGMTASGIVGYPLLAVGNSAYVTNTVSSIAYYNALSTPHIYCFNASGDSNNISQTAITPKAALEVVSTNSGVLFPLMTGAQESGISSTDLQTGLLLYNSDAGCYQFYTGSIWKPVGLAGSLAGFWQSLGNNGTTAGSKFAGTSDSVSLVFRSDNIQRLTVTAGGKVGIGTTTPQANARLAVNGIIYAQKIEATLTGWPDYVFGQHYRLTPLDSLGAIRN